MRVRFIAGAHRAWRFFSVQAMALVVAIQAGWQAMPDDMASRIPDAWVTGLSITVLVLGIMGRLVRQDDA